MPITCTEAEWKILEVLWDHAPATMREITDSLEASTGWTRHTVITLLKRMQKKGSIHCDEGGEVKQYTPLVSRDQASTRETQSLVTHVFSGDAALLVRHLIDKGEVTREDLEELMRAMRTHEAQ